MADKWKLSTILGICGATVLASGGSIFLTDTALSLIEKDQSVVQEAEPGLNEKETEKPITIEQFAKTDDFFVITVNKDKKEKESEKETQGESGQSDTSGSSASAGGSAASGTSDNAASGSNSPAGQSGTGGHYDSNGLYHDEWGGWYNENGDYYDGNGGYYDGDGYHYVGTPDTFAPGRNPGTSGGSSSGGSSSGGSSNDGYNSDGVQIENPSGGGSSAWDDSYKCYEISSRYLSKSELKGWGPEDLAQLRNEIFARHGRIFTTQKWINYFATKTWYTPTYSADYFDANMDSFLNEYEWGNLEMILKLEDEISY